MKGNFGGGWMAHNLNPDHDAIGHIFNLVHPSVIGVSFGGEF